MEKRCLEKATSLGLAKCLVHNRYSVVIGKGRKMDGY